MACVQIHSLHVAFVVVVSSFVMMSMCSSPRTARTLWLVERRILQLFPELRETVGEFCLALPG